MTIPLPVSGSTPDPTPRDESVDARRAFNARLDARILEVLDGRAGALDAEGIWLGYCERWAELADVRRALQRLKARGVIVAVQRGFYEAVSP